MELGTIIQRFDALPSEAYKSLLNELKLTNSRFTPAGAVLIGMQLLVMLGIPQLIDEILEEKHTTIEHLKGKYEQGEKCVPSLGMVIAILVADMLAYPKHIIRVYKAEEMSEEWNTGPLLGISHKSLNDDRILRSLSKLGGKKGAMQEILQVLTINVAEKYKIPLKRFFIDTTLLQLDGQFKKSEKVTNGRGTDSFSQLIVGLVTAATSRLPVNFAVFPGNTNDGTTLPDVLASLDKIASPGPVECIYDRAFPTASNIIYMQNQERKYMFIGPLKTEKAGEKFRELVDRATSENLFQSISFRSSIEIKNNIQPSYSAYETEWTLEHKDTPPLEPGQDRRPKGSIIRQEVTVRCVIYRNDNQAKNEKEARIKKRNECEKALDEFSHKINKRNLRELSACQVKIKEVLSKFPQIKKFIKTELSNLENGAVKFSWSWEEEDFKKEENYDGIFALLTNHDKNDVGSNNLIKDYRERNQVEMSFANLRGILDLERIFVQIPERIDAYIFVKILAYFVLAFLRRYGEEHGLNKMSEASIQEEYSKLGISKIEIQPLGISEWFATNDNYTTKWYRNEFNLPDPNKEVEHLNDFVNVNEKIEIWLEKWKKENVMLENITSVLD